MFKTMTTVMISALVGLTLALIVTVFWAKGCEEHGPLGEHGTCNN